MPHWVAAFAVIVVLQTVTALESRLVPVISPAFMAEFGWDESWVGYLSAAGVVGSVFMITAGIGLLYRMGGVFALQVALAIGAAGLALFMVPSLAVALFAGVLIGLSNGVANPAGSEVLHRVTPPQNRNLVFSVKQAGVPLGGVIAGLAVPPVVEAAGWRIALLLTAVTCVVVVALTLPFRSRIDPPRDPSVPVRLVSFRLSHVLEPMRSLSRGVALWRMSWVGCLLAFPQAVWVTFAATFLVVAQGLSLSVAGLVYAVMQATSMIGRVLMGWFADRVASSTATLALASAASAICTIALGFVTPEWPLWALTLLAAVAGISVSGWNGVQVAEIARRSPTGMVAETAAGSVILIYGSNMLGPVFIAAFVAWTGRFDLAFMISGVLVLICLPLLWRIEQPAK
jgi:MFS family permease